MRRWDKTETVKITTLDKLIAKLGSPKFCKIDVEGYEEQVLKGLSVPIEYISLEYTLPERLESLSNCLHELSRIGSFDCNYTIGEDMKLELSEWVGRDKLIHEVKQFGNREMFGDIYIHGPTFL